MDNAVGVVPDGNISKPTGSVARQHRPGLDAALTQMAMSLVPLGSAALLAPAAEALRAVLLQASRPGTHAVDGSAPDKGSLR